MEIIKAARSDLSVVMRIVQTTINEIYPRYYPADVVDFFLSYHNTDKVCWDIEQGDVYLLRDEGEARGTGSIENGNHINRVYVLPEFQRCGYGSAIMDKLEHIVSAEHDIAIVESSMPAYAMYTRRGYAPVSYHEYDTGGNGVLCYHIMEKPLNK